jgi:hypothetical protein
MAKRTKPAPKSANTTKTTKTTKTSKGTNTKGLEIGKIKEVQPEQLGPLERAQNQEISPLERVQAETIDRTRSDEFRQRQMALADQLSATARGEGPSVAGTQLREATDRAIANQMAVARSGGGPLAMRNAQLNTSQLQQEASRTASLTKMAEAIQAQNSLGGVLAQGREGDITLDTNQAGLNQNANITNANAANQRGVQQAQLNQDVALANATAANLYGYNQANLNQNANIVNANSYNQRNLSQAQINQAVRNAQIGAAATVSAAGAGASASRYATDAGLYKFNQQLGFDMDRYYQGQGRDDANSRYGIDTNRENNNRSSRQRENDDLGAAAGYSSTQDQRY